MSGPQAARRGLLAMVGAVSLLAGACGGGGEVSIAAPWTFADPPNRGSSELAIVVLGGGCNYEQEELGEIDVEETPERVVVAAHLVKPADEPRDCVDIGTSHPATVRLADPLGDRAVVDSSCELLFQPEDCAPVTAPP